ncbi:serine hydrolase [Riemerella anatipestifer]|uniref:serine hydrolase n=1 Tax=Riemerella anatipestifer TaxID=34085 RepID=UPI001F257F58|nr:serine hydrolase [Riemerella anatipestifer]
MLENTWSPFKEKYPNGNISISLEEALHWMIVYSDNNMTDILLRLIGGTNAVEKFIDDENFVIKNNEDEMHKDWNSQFINKSTPNSFTKLLKNFSEGKMLNSENTEMAI